MTPAKFLVGCLALGISLAQPTLAGVTCKISQVTQASQGSSDSASISGRSVAFRSDADLTGGNDADTPELFLFDGTAIRQVKEKSSFSLAVNAISLDNGMIAFQDRADLTGHNPDMNDEIFLYDGSGITQITDSVGPGSGSPSLDGGSIAFDSSADLTGENPDGNLEIFLYNGSTIKQITHSTTGFSAFPSLDGGSIAFEANADLLGPTADDTIQIYLYDGTGIRQITHSSEERNAVHPSLDGGMIAFESSGDLVGDNPQGNSEIFLYDGASIVQITKSIQGGSHRPSLSHGSIAFFSDAYDPNGNDQVFLFDGSSIQQITSSDGISNFPSLDGNRIAFSSSGDLVGKNPNHQYQIFVASCVPSPPPGPYLTSPEIPGFRFKVRLTAGGQEISGRQETDCLGETLCVSGALPGRSELFLRIIGPRPNGYLWADLARFTTSRVEVWAEQLSSGVINYYDLPALPREDTGLTGLVDKEAFLPTSPVDSVAPVVPPSYSHGPETTPHDSVSVASLPRLLARRRAQGAATADVFPGYRFTVHIYAGGEEQPVQVEADCIPETICLSGAVPGRSELFLRLIGPRPNGFLWTNLVRFTTSRVEVEIEQLATGATRSYVLDEVPRNSDRLPGRVDREAFLPP